MSDEGDGTATGPPPGPPPAPAPSSPAPLRHVEFEIYGLVQNVFMRQHVVSAGRLLGVAGNAYNTDNTETLPSQDPTRKKCTGTVRGEACGPPAAVANFVKYISGKWTQAQPVRVCVCFCALCLVVCLLWHCLGCS
jgi:acylphosphatase